MICCNLGLADRSTLIDPTQASSPARLLAWVPAMEVEQKQGDLVQQFVLLAGNARGRAAVELITHATSHPNLFAFSELLSSPHIAEVLLLRTRPKLFFPSVCLFDRSDFFFFA